MIKRLRVKFVCINMALVMTMLAVMLVMVYRFTASGLQDSSVAALKAAAETKMQPGRPGAGTNAYFMLQEGLGGSIIVVGSQYFDLSDEEMVTDIYIRAKEQATQVGELEDYALRFFRTDGIQGDRYFFADISAEQAALKNLLTTCALIGAAGFGAFLVISVLLARWAIRPVEKAWQQQRQFVADASHELKTPLTVILTNAELLQSPDYSAQEKRQFSDSILTVSRQMRGLVENLLQLARADQGKTTAEKTRVDLSRLTEEALLPFEPVYFERGLMLESQIEEGIAVLADPTQLRQVLDILLDNGQKYAIPEGKAVLTLTRQGRSKVQLRFFTPGEPLSAQQCADIFKRFYRVDESRTASGSYGLGLSIAQRITEQCGGKIWAAGGGGGNTFFVTLPVLTATEGH